MLIEYCENFREVLLTPLIFRKCFHPQSSVAIIPGVLLLLGHSLLQTSSQPVLSQSHSMDQPQVGVLKCILLKSFK